MKIELEHIKLVAKILKQRFPNLSVEQTIDLASDILSVLPQENEK